MYKLGKDLEVHSSEYDILYEYLDDEPNAATDLTITRKIRYMVTIKSKTGEEIKSIVHLLDAPVVTELGCKLGGTLYAPVSTDKRASGWYITTEKRNGVDGLVLEFVPESGFKIMVREKNKELSISFGSNDSKEFVNIGVFLKALTGKSFKELCLILGVRNRYIVSSLINEPSRDACIIKTLAGLTQSKFTNDENLPIDFKYKEINRRLYSKQFLDFGASMERTQRAIKFSERALGLTLAKPVLNYEKGTELSKEVLDDIDSSNVNTLFVSNRAKVFELKKYPVTEELCAEEFFNMINMYACCLDGLPKIDDKYELFNRSIITYEDKIHSRVKERLLKINSSVHDYFLYNRENTLLVNYSFPDFDTEDLIRDMKNGSKRIAQSSETTNVIATTTKDYKVISDYSGRSSESLVRVKDSEFGIYDPYNQPESKKVGFTHNRTITSVRDTDGVYKGKFVKVINGEPNSNDVELLDPFQITNSYIAPWDADFSKDIIQCHYNGRLVNVPKDKVQYQEYSCLSTLSPPSAMISFYNHSNGKRVVMSDNQVRQAPGTLKSERPLVSTGVCGYLNLGLIRAEDILAKYYIDNSLTHIDYDEFIKCKIKLVDTDISVPGYRDLLFDVEVPTSIMSSIRTLNSCEVLVIKYTINSCKRNSDDTLVQYNIVPSKDNCYQGKDLVAYDNTIDVKKYNLIKYVDFGHAEYDESCLDSDISVGYNFRVGWKSYSSTTMDDAITIRQGLVGTGILTHYNLNEIRVELMKPDDDGTHEEFTKIGTDPAYESNGLPKIGTHLKPSSVVCYKQKIKPSDTDAATIIDTSKRLDAVTEGEVIQASIVENKAIIMLASTIDVQPGDKMSGGHGNKGVIAKFVPDSEMAYDEDGVPLDICLNPQGVPSRMNLSQFLEGILGFVARKMGNDTAFVVTPGYKGTKDLVMKYAEEYDIKPMTLYDGRTGRPFDRKINVGYLYMKPLKHFVTSKANSTGLNLNVNPTTLQAVKGKKAAGGQTIGEMEVWSLASAGATNFLQELFSIQSDDFSNKKKLDKNPNMIINQSELNNKNDEILLTARLLGVNMYTDENGLIQSDIMTDSDISSLSNNAIDDKSGLHNASIFGVTTTPSLLSKARKRWGFIKLNCEIINPNIIYNSKLPNLILGKQIDDSEEVKPLKPLNSKLLREVIEAGSTSPKGEKSYLAFTNEGIYYSKNPDITPYHWECGISAVVKAFKRASLDKAKSYYENSLSNKKSPKDSEIFEYKQMLDVINNFKKKGFELKDAIITTYPVLPRNFRLENAGRPSHFDMLYSNIISASKSNSGGVDRSTDVFFRIVELLGIDQKHMPGGKADAITFMRYFTGKGSDNVDGHYRDKTLSKIVDFSFRGVIMPAEAGTLTIDQIGVPFSMAVNCLKIFIKPLIFNKYPQIKADISKKVLDERDLFSAICNEDVYKISSIFSTNLEEANVILEDLIDICTNYAESRVVAAGRQPTLHKLGIRGYRVRVVKGKAIQLHPLVCPAYNADFDGDQMWGTFALSDKSSAELLEKMSPVGGYINPKDDSFVLTPFQDILLGTYLATMLFNNKLSIEGDDRYSDENVLFYDDLTALKYDLKDGITKYQNLICYKHTNGNLYLSTAGRVVFNSLIPDCLTDEVFTNPLRVPNIDVNNYRELRFDGLIKKKKDNGDAYRTFGISEVCKFLYENYKPNVVCDVMNEILIFGTRACDGIGMTLGLWDFIEHPQLDDYIEKSKKLADKVNKYYEMGLISAEDRKNSTYKVYKFATEYIRNTLLDYYDRDNNLFIMIDSGARGNVGQLAQSCGLIGVVSKTSNEMLESPILSNYFRGLNSAEQNYLSYATRIGVSAVQNDTAIAGSLTRDLAYTLGGFTIVEHDCKNSDATFDVLYTSDFLSVTLNGEPVDSTDIIGLAIDNSDEDLLKYSYLGSEKVNSNVINFIKKNKIRELITSNGVVRFKYKLSKLFRNLMKNRVAKNLEFLITNSYSDDGIITDKTLDWIEQENLITINVRTMLTCNSVGGVCARCYGLRSDTKMYPQIGDYIGFEAAQSMGEPATQLNMERINKIGMSEGGAVSGVEVFRSYARGSFPSRGLKAVVADKSGFISIEDLGRDLVKIVGVDGVRKVHKSNLKVQDKEYVKRGDILTEGFINVNEIQDSDPIREMRMRQVTLLNILFDIFTGSSLDVNARVFECLVRALISMVRVLDSNDPNIIAGRTYFLPEVVGKDCTFYSVVEPKDKVVAKYSGSLASLTSRSFAKTLVKVSTVPDFSNSNVTNSVLGKIFSGTNVSSYVPKIIEKPRFTSIESFSIETSKSDSFVKLLDDTKVEQVSKTLESLDLSSLLEDTDLDLDLDIEDEVASDLSESNAFTNEKSEPLKTEDEFNNNVEISTSNFFS